MAPIGNKDEALRCNDMSDPDAELDAMVALLEQAGLVASYVNDEGNEAMRLTPQGERSARQMAMSSGDDQDTLLAALLKG